MMRSLESPRGIGEGREHLIRVFDRAQRSAEKYAAKLGTLRMRAEEQTDDGADSAELTRLADDLREDARTLHWGLQYFRQRKAVRP